MGAMENWGLVTYRTTAVLFDEGKSDSRYKNRIAYVVAHGEPQCGCIIVTSLLTRTRACAPVVWEPGNYGLVERALVKRGLCDLGWVARCRSLLSRWAPTSNSLTTT
jgi:hypothetical protein